MDDWAHDEDLIDISGYSEMVKTESYLTFNSEFLVVILGFSGS